MMYCVLCDLPKGEDDGDESFGRLTLSVAEDKRYVGVNRTLACPKGSLDCGFTKEAQNGSEGINPAQVRYSSLPTAQNPLAMRCLVLTDVTCNFAFLLLRA